MASAHIVPNNPANRTSCRFLGKLWPSHDHHPRVAMLRLDEHVFAWLDSPATLGRALQAALELEHARSRRIWWPVTV